MKFIAISTTIILIVAACLALVYCIPSHRTTMPVYRQEMELQAIFAAMNYYYQECDGKYPPNIELLDNYWPGEPDLKRRVVDYEIIDEVIGVDKVWIRSKVADSSGRIWYVTRGGGVNYYRGK